MKAPRTILVPVDLSDFSFTALQYAEEIAALFGDPAVTVLYVEEHDGHRGESDAEADAALEAKARDRITLLMVEKQIAHAHVNVLVRHGKPATNIVEVARELDIDLIVVSTHGRTGLRHVLMGSVAEKVVRYAPCPVLTIKPEEFREIVSLTEDDVAGSLHLHQSV